MSEVADLSFRPLREDDLPLLHEWLRRPHVARWWNPAETLAEIEAKYRPRIAGEEPVDLYLAVEAGEPVAFLQTYLEDEVTAGMDVFIADEARTGKGEGSELIRRFVDEVVFRRAETLKCIADPEETNAPSIRAFAKAGFTVLDTFDDPHDEKRHVLVRKDRA
jgi:RimJ/RimL family protein N-acetyltransferase